MTTLKNQVFICLILFFITDLHAQAGLRLGLNFADFNSGNSLYEYKSKYKTGIGIGAYYKYNISESLHFQPEILYMQMGWIIKEDDYKEEFHLHYIQFFFPIQYTFFSSKVINMYLTAGPYAGLAPGKYKILDCEDFECSSIKQGYSATRDSGPRFYDFGGIFGGGFSINEHFSVELRFLYGIVNHGYDSEISMKNKSYFLSSSYTF